MNVAVIIPAFNEEKTLGAVLTTMDSAWGVIVVDDGSSDDTVRVAEAAGAQVVLHHGNRGYDAALQTGLDVARNENYHVAVTIDADGQIPTNVVKLALQRMDEGVDLVLGKRSRKARWAESLYSAYAWYRYGVTDILCGLKAYRLSSFQFLPDFSMNRSIGTAVALAGLRVGVRWGEVDVPIRVRNDSSRFGSGLNANWRILKGAYDSILADLCPK